MPRRRELCGSRLPTGRALSVPELSALFAVCGDGTPAGARDAAALALLFGCALRRSEAVSVKNSRNGPCALRSTEWMIDKGRGWPQGRAGDRRG